MRGRMSNSIKLVRISSIVLASICLFQTPLLAQHQHSEMQGMEEHGKNAASEFLQNEAAGTAVNPSSSITHMLMKEKGEWMLMAHGFAFLNWVNQSGPRGEDRVFSTNHVMLIGARPLSQKSSLLLRGMFSLEPATITDRHYPELFQTGETAFGRAIVDGQHPHDLFMEISIQYAYQLNANTLVHLYAAPVGDPALGPVAYPHRISAEELPQATLGHHLQDSTHIANDVLTAGLKYKFIRWEVSAFHGAEPDEDRWDVDAGAIDSWSTRVTFSPHDDWVAQASTGHLTKPEELEPGDVQRTTASFTYNRKMRDSVLATSLLFGWNHKLEEDTNQNGFGIESLYRFKHINYVTGRIESVEKDELFANDPETKEHFESLGVDQFRINAFTLGYARDFNWLPNWGAGIGGNFTLYSFPSELKTIYGDTPKSFLVYLRIRPGHASH